MKRYLFIALASLTVLSVSANFVEENKALQEEVARLEAQMNDLQKRTAEKQEATQVLLETVRRLLEAFEPSKQSTE